MRLCDDTYHTTRKGTLQRAYRRLCGDGMISSWLAHYS